MAGFPDQWPECRRRPDVAYRAAVGSSGTAKPKADPYWHPLPDDRFGVLSPLVGEHRPAQVRPTVLVLAYAPARAPPRRATESTVSATSNTTPVTMYVAAAPRPIK